MRLSGIVPAHIFGARPNGTTPADPSKIALPPALWLTRAARANSLLERFCLIPPAATPASPTPCSAPLSDFRSHFACRRMLLPSENEFCRHTAQISSTPTRPRDPTEPLRCQHSQPSPVQM